MIKAAIIPFKIVAHIIAILFIVALFGAAFTLAAAMGIVCRKGGRRNQEDW